MGYYTYFSLEMTMENGDEVDKDLIEEVRHSFNKIFTSHFSYSDNHDYFSNIYEGEDGGVEWKWYEDEEDMQKLAVLYPNIHFTVYGEGEDHFDFWIKDYLGDKKSVRYGEIVYPDLWW